MDSEPEKIAFDNFINYFIKKYKNLDFPTYILENLINDSNDGIFGIFLHKPNDLFSNKFSNLLTQKVVHNLNFLTWDISDTTNNINLLIKVENVLGDTYIIDLLKEQKAGFLLFQKYNKNFNILECFEDDFNEDDFIRDVTTDCGFERESFLKVDYSNIKFSNMNNIGIIVEDNLRSAIQKSFDEEKLLLLHVYNINQFLPQTFLDILNNRDVNQFINKFIFYHCDLFDSETKASIKNLYREFKFLTSLSSHILRQESTIFVFKKLDENIENIENECFEGNLSQQKLLTVLFKIYNDFEKEKKDILCQKEKISAESTVKIFTSNFCENNFSFERESLNNALEQHVLVQPEYLRKILIICLYDEADSDCIDFFSHMFDDQDISNVVCAMYHILLWDVKDENLHKTLKYLNKLNFDNKSIEEKIENEETGIFFVQAVDEKVEIILEYDLGTLVPEALKRIVATLAKNLVNKTGATDLVEIEATKKFARRRIISFSHSLIFECLPLQRLIDKKCTIQNVEERKMLLLHLQNGSQESELLKTLPTIFENLKTYFCVVAWDISDQHMTRKLLLANERYFRSKKIKEALDNQKSESFIFIPTTDTMAFAGNLSNFGNIINIFNKEKQNFGYQQGPFVFQQEICKQLGDRDYNYFNLEDPEHMKLFHDWIGFAIFGLPSEKKDKYTKDQIEHINEVKKQIQTQAGKYSVNPKNIYVACVYICSIPSGVNFKNHISLPVIAVQKCSNAPGKSCRFYVDSNLRVYSSWENYLKENNLVAGTYIVPQDGSYQIDCYGKLRLECIYDEKILAKLVNSMDKTSMLAGFASTVVSAFALFTAIPVAPVLLAGAAVTGAGVGAYALGRGAYNLYDKHTHEESMDIRNREARMAYLNLAAGTFSFATAGATATLSYFARNGHEIGEISIHLINIMCGANIAVNGVNIGNSFHDVIYNWSINGQRPNALMIVQLTSSVLFFGHSVYNAQSATTMIDEAQAQKMNDLQRNLSVKQKKMLNKMTKETIRQQGDVQQGYREVISTLNSVDNAKDILATLGRNNNHFNEKNVRFAAANGEVHFNGVKVDLKTFDSLSNTRKMDYLASQNTIIKGNLRHRINLQNSINNHFNSPPLLLQATRIFSVVGSKLKLNTNDSLILSMFSELIVDQLFLILGRFLEKVALDANLEESFRSLVKGTPLELIIDFFEMRGLELVRTSFVESSCERGNMILDYMERGIMWASLYVDGLIRELLDFSTTWLAQRAYASQLDSETIPVLEENEGVLCEICKGRRLK